MPTQQTAKALRPLCLHVPVLYSEEETRVSWEPFPDAEAYTLSFQYDYNLNKDAFLSDSDLTIPAGQASRVRGCDQGYSWRDIRHVQSTWSQSDALPGSSAKALATWQDRALLKPTGLHWFQIDFDDLSWAEFEALPNPTTEEPDATGLRWKDLFFWQQRGLSWQTLRHMHLRWEEIDSCTLRWTGEDVVWTQHPETLPPSGPLPEDDSWLSWDVIEHLPQDDNTHLGYTLPASCLPPTNQRARLKLTANLPESDADTVALTAAGRYIWTLDDTTLLVQTGDTPMLHLDAQRVRSFSNAGFALVYDATVLKLEALETEVLVDGIHWDAQVVVLDNRPGRVIFECAREIAEGQHWSGLVAQVHMRALKAGKTTVSLLRVNTGTQRVV